MSRVMEGWRRLRSRWRSEFESGLDEEIRFHIDRQTEKNRRAGMVPDEAHRQALITFGGVERTKESTRATRSALPLLNTSFVTSAMEPARCCALRGSRS